MRCKIILFLLFCSLFANAQPGGYVDGTFVNWSFNSRDHGFGKSNRFDAVHDSLKRVLIHFEGDGETNSSGLTTQAPGKYLNDAGTNWDMKVIRANGDTIQFMVLTLFNIGYFPSTYKSDIEYFFTNAANLPDTSKHHYYAMGSFSGGPGRMWGTMLESGFVYANVIGTTLSVSPTFLGVDVTTISANKRNVVFRNGDDANGGTPEGAANDLFNDLSGFKSLKKPPSTGQGHSADSAYSIFGVANNTLTDSSKSFWRLVAEWVPPTPPPPPSTNQITPSFDRIYDWNGRKGKTLTAWFDNNTGTKLNISGLNENDFVNPYRSFVVLDSVYKRFSFQYYVAFPNNISVDVKLYDSSRTLLTTKTITSSGSTGWAAVEDIDTSYRVRFVEVYGDSGAESDVNIYEMRLYGDALFAAQSIYPTTTVTPFVDQGAFGHGVCTLDDRLLSVDSLGNNIITKMFKTIRVGYEATRFDLYPNHYTDNADGAFWLGRFGTDHTRNRIKTFIDANNLKAHIYRNGGSLENMTAGAANANTSYLDQAQNFRRTNSPSDNPETAGVWSNLGFLWRKITALFGSNTSASLSGITVSGGTGTAGQNIYQRFEIGNEGSRDWHGVIAYESPLANYRKMVQVYADAKAADPNAEVISEALTFMNTSYIRAQSFIHYWLTGSMANFPNDGFAMNLYQNTDLDGQAQSTVSNGVSPETWGLDTRLDSLGRLMRKLFPNKPVYWTELMYAVDTSSPYDVRQVGSFTPHQVAGNLSLRSKAIGQSLATNFIPTMYAYAFFADGSFAFNSMALQRENFSPSYTHSTVTAAGYSFANEFAAESEYNFFAARIVTGDTNSVWVTRKNHSIDPLKKLYKVWRGSMRGLSTSNYVLNVGEGAASATLYTMRYNQYTPLSTPLTISGNSVTIPSVTEAMSWVEVTYSSAFNGITKPRGKRFKFVQQ